MMLAGRGCLGSSNGQDPEGLGGHGDQVCTAQGPSLLPALHYRVLPDQRVTWVPKASKASQGPR
jgi:hypothetical protein